MLLDFRWVNDPGSDMENHKAAERAAGALNRGVR